MSEAAVTADSVRVPEVVIKPRQGWQMINLAELAAYKDLYWFLVKRDIKVRYAQSVLGVGWAVIQPLFMMVVQTVLFSVIAGLKSDGDGTTPYWLFNFCALVPWMYFSNALNEAAGSMVSSAGMLNKVYFPRLILPFTSVLSKFVDFIITMVILLGMMVAVGVYPNANILMLPVLVLMMSMAAAGMGMWLTSLAIQYRDIRYGMNFGVQLLMWLTPVAYPASVYEGAIVKYLGEDFRYLYGINPMAGVVEGFRSALLGDRPMPWELIGIGAAVTVFLFVTGAYYFKRMERFFADVA